jgi:hypothetical protein
MAAALFEDSKIRRQEVIRYCLSYLWTNKKRMVSSGNIRRKNVKRNKRRIILMPGDMRPCDGASAGNRTGPLHRSRLQKYTTGACVE